MDIYHFVIVLASALNGGQSEVDPYTLAVAPGQNFSFTCKTRRRHPSEDIEWQLIQPYNSVIQLGKNFTKIAEKKEDGTLYKTGQITCRLAETENDTVNTIYCLNNAAVWKKKSWKNFFNPPKQVVLRVECFQSIISNANLHIRLLPKPPSLSCLILDGNELHCRWRDQGNETHYTLIYHTTEIGYQQTHFEACNGTRDTSCVVKFDKDQLEILKLFYYMRLNITLEATNLVGSNSTSMNCYPAAIPSAPKGIVLRSKYYADEREYLHVGDDNQGKALLERLQNNENHFSWECWNAFCETPPDNNNAFDWTSKTLFTKNGEMTADMLDLMANTSYVVRARYKAQNFSPNLCSPNVWSDFSYSNVTKTEPIKPGKTEVAMLWFEHPTEFVQKFLVHDESFILAWKEDNNPRYNYNLISAYSLTLNYSGDNKAKSNDFSNCAVQFKAMNEIGSSKVETCAFASEMAVKVNAFTVSPSSDTLAVIDVELSCQSFINESWFPCSNATAVIEEQYSLVVFFWPIGEGVVPTENLIRQPSQVNIWKSDSITINVTMHSKSLKKGALTVSVHKPAEESPLLLRYPKHTKDSPVDTESTLQFKSIRLDSYYGNHFRGNLSYNFTKHNPYQFAVSLKSNEAIGPASLSADGYIFGTQAPSGSPNNVTVKKDSSIVEWQPVDLQQQHGRIIQYQVYISTKENCGRFPQKLMGYESCAEECPKPDDVKRFDVSPAGGRKNIIQNYIIPNVKGHISKSIKNSTLVEGRHYIRISAKNQDGEGPCSETVLGFVNKSSGYGVPVIIVAVLVTTAVVVSITLYIKDRISFKKFFPPPPTPSIARCVISDDTFKILSHRTVAEQLDLISDDLSTWGPPRGYSDGIPDRLNLEGNNAGQGCAPYTSMAKTLESTPLGKTENCQERDKSLEDFDCVENSEDDDSDTEHSSQNRDNSGSSEGYTHPCFDECANC
ncbi:uncharacterized protein LOC143464692 isoform X2 [Clavelina lepadiformis]|uniref:uncharacterized protein LOC143464692 isoform X2 n=1 Tax=Clavelina lepadiformis TaxID=159417 RepID=UPI004042A971